MIPLIAPHFREASDGYAHAGCGSLTHAAVNRLATCEAQAFVRAISDAPRGSTPIGAREDSTTRSW
jgi:hypothetical protein